MKRLTDEELASVRRTLSATFGTATSGLKKLLENYQAQLEQALIDNTRPPCICGSLTGAECPRHGFY